MGIHLELWGKIEAGASVVISSDSALAASEGSYFVERLARQLTSGATEPGMVTMGARWVARHCQCHDPYCDERWRITDEPPPLWLRDFVEGLGMRWSE